MIGKATRREGASEKAMLLNEREDILLWSVQIRWQRPGVCLWLSLYPTSTRKELGNTQSPSYRQVRECRGFGARKAHVAEIGIEPKCRLLLFSMTWAKRRPLKALLFSCYWSGKQSWSKMSVIADKLYWDGERMFLSMQVVIRAWPVFSKEPRWPSQFSVNVGYLWYSETQMLFLLL